MKLFRSASAALLLGMQVFACVAACGQLKSFAKTRTEVSTDRFKLLSEGDQFVETQYKTLSAASGVAYRGTRHLSRS
jgi:hypothetical protein